MLAKLRLARGRLSISSSVMLVFWTLLVVSISGNPPAWRTVTTWRLPATSKVTWRLGTEPTRTSTYGQPKARDASAAGHLRARANAGARTLVRHGIIRYCGASAPPG